MQKRSLFSYLGLILSLSLTANGMEDPDNLLPGFQTTVRRGFPPAHEFLQSRFKKPQDEAHLAYTKTKILKGLYMGTLTDSTLRSLNLELFSELNGPFWESQRKPKEIFSLSLLKVTLLRTQNKGFQDFIKRQASDPGPMQANYHYLHSIMLEPIDKLASIQAFQLALDGKSKFAQHKDGVEKFYETKKIQKIPRNFPPHYAHNGVQEAYKLLELSAHQGFAAAYHNLGLLVEEFNAINPVAERQNLTFFKKAASMGYSYALYKLAEINSWVGHHGTIHYQKCLKYLFKNYNCYANFYFYRSPSVINYIKQHVAIDYPQCPAEVPLGFEPSIEVFQTQMHQLFFFPNLVRDTHLSQEGFYQTTFSIPSFSNLFESSVMFSIALDSALNDLIKLKMQAESPLCEETIAFFIPSSTLKVRREDDFLYFNPYPLIKGPFYKRYSSSYLSEYIPLPNHKSFSRESLGKRAVQMTDFFLMLAAEVPALQKDLELTIDIYKNISQRLTKAQETDAASASDAYMAAKEKLTHMAQREQELKDQHKNFIDCVIGEYHYLLKWKNSVPKYYEFNSLYDVTLTAELLSKSSYFQDEWVKTLWANLRGTLFRAREHIALEPQVYNQPFVPVARMSKEQSDPSATQQYDWKETFNALDAYVAGLTKNQAWIELLEEAYYNRFLLMAPHNPELMAYSNQQAIRAAQTLCDKEIKNLSTYLTQLSTLPETLITLLEKEGERSCFFFARNHFDLVRSNPAYRYY